MGGLGEILGYRIKLSLAIQQEATKTTKETGILG
jgi:hypothetical protein